MNNIIKQGIINYNPNVQVISNPPLSSSVTGWTHLVLRNGLVTQRISDGNASSPVFSIQDNEIIKVTFTIKTSAFTSGSGIFWGTKPSSAYQIYTLNSSTKKYTARTPSGTWDRYFFKDFKSTSIGIITSYIIGYDVPIECVPLIESSGISGNLEVIKMTQNIGTTYLNTGWNASESTNEWTYYDIGVHRFSRIVNGKPLEINNMTINEIYED